jgi:hypothetical protein
MADGEGAAALAKPESILVNSRAVPISSAHGEGRRQVTSTLYDSLAYTCAACDCAFFERDGESLERQLAARLASAMVMFSLDAFVDHGSVSAPSSA